VCGGMPRECCSSETNNEPSDCCETRSRAGVLSGKKSCCASETPPCCEAP
jgi:hypothetical protein